jgi:hypothetical protein
MGATLDWHAPKHDLIRKHSPAKVNDSIDRETLEHLGQIGDAPHAIRQRLWVLDREWHIDRALMAVFSVLGAFTAHRSYVAARRGNRSGWRLVLWTQMGFLLHHAIRGWCPPVSVLRRLGFRTEKEIAGERTTLEKRLASSTGI